jgi:hypothetical protein
MFRLAIYSALSILIYPKFRPSNGCETLYIVDAGCGLQYRIQLETLLEISKIYDFSKIKVMTFMN